MVKLLIQKSFIYQIQIFISPNQMEKLIQYLNLNNRRNDIKKFQHKLRKKEMDRIFEEYLRNSSNYISSISQNLSEKYYKKGLVAAGKNKFKEAATNYKKALEYNPDNISANMELDNVVDKVAQEFYEKGMISYSKNEIDKAMEYFRKALYFKPNKIEAKRALDRIR